ncbi:MAG: chromosome segregation protein SMC, partial [Xanthomonadales bacterium]|nr:chromosome segregation protein SMC [Xanthomonadales bacterium]
MRLTSIKLAGFKSFVDATTFRAPTNLTGVVGPNGCGKSNIIDAVRWVMGEGSARVLRGELMSDVIFSGSTSRKPVGTATVELIFDNSDGQIGGEYASFSEISVKRTVGRDGISQYFLNGTKCRRKDVKDLFLGTGLGSSSYSIIEQGMISRVVDARPEDIRQHLEEAAGISRYKDRRRETERRISHTRENLDRLSDLREEVSNHLARLKRQARAAERYKQLKQQRRELEGRLLALQWRELQGEAGQGKAGLGAEETALQEQIARQREAEARMEALHQKQSEASDKLSKVQGEMYAIASDIARLEQSIQHQRELQQSQSREHEEVSAALKDLEQHMMLDRTQVEHLTTQLADAEPSLAAAEKAESAADAELHDADAAVQQWQEQFEHHHRRHAELERQCDAFRSRIELLEQRLQAAVARLEDLAREQVEMGDAQGPEELDELAGQLASAAQAEQERAAAVQDTRQRLSAQRDEWRDTQAQELEVRRQLNAARGRLDALQNMPVGAAESEQGRAWLEAQGLEQAPQLVGLIETETGWEQAVETVLGHWLQSLVVADTPGVAAGLERKQGIALDLLDSRSGDVRPRNGSLAEKVRGPDAIIAMLNHVRVVDSLEEAIEFLDLDADEESAITRDGAWIGPGWRRLSGGGEQGIIEREKEIRELGSQVDELESAARALAARGEDLAAEISLCEDQVEAQQSELNDAHQLHRELLAQSSSLESQHAQDSERRQRLAEERERLEAQCVSDRDAIAQARRELEQALESMAAEEQRRSELEGQRRGLMEARDSARTQARQARDRRHELAVKAGSHRASLDSLNQSLERMGTQASQLQQRFLALSEALASGTDPEQASKAEMDELLRKRVEKEEALSAARATLQALEAEYRKEDEQRQSAVRKTEEVLERLERARLAQQEIELNARSLKQRVEELGEDVTALAAAIPE